MRRHVLKSISFTLLGVILAGATANACTGREVAVKFNQAVGLPQNTPPRVLSPNVKVCICNAGSKQETVQCLSGLMVTDGAEEDTTDSDAN